MADQFVQVQPDSTGKKVDTSELTVGANTVERQRMVLASDTSAAALASIANSAPAGTEYALLVRNIPSGTQNVNTTQVGSTNVSAFPAGFQRVTTEPTQIFYDPFDSALDTTNRWSAPVTGGTAGATAAAVALGNLTLSSGTATTSFSYIRSVAAFVPTVPGWLGNSHAIKLPFTPPTAKNYMFWGVGTPQASPTAALPIVDGVGFEIDTAGKMWAVVFAGGTRTQVQDLSSSGNAKQPTDTSFHRYICYVRTDKIYWYIDGLDSASLVATANFASPQVQTLPVIYFTANDPSIGPASNNILTVAGVAVWDTAQNNLMLSDGQFGWRKATVKPASTAAATTDTALVVSISPNSPATVSGAAATGATKSGNPVQIGGVFNSPQIGPVAGGQAVEVSATARGALIVATGVDTFNATISAGINSIGKVVPWDGSTASSAGRIVPWDGTNTPSIGKTIPWDGTTAITVKAASTSISTGDSALVVGISPNNSQAYVFSNATITASSSSGFILFPVTATGYAFTVSAGGVSGTTPGIQFTITETDFNGFTLGSPVTGSIITTAGIAQTIILPRYTTGRVTVSWNVTGTTPSFSGVYATIKTITSNYITDGTTNVAVKAASTAAIATDPALVAALSPNSPLPIGSNLIGKVGIDQTTVGTTNAVSLAQIGAVTVATGTGIMGTGVQRVAIASDNDPVTVKQTTAANLNATIQGPASSGTTKSGNPLQIGGVFNSTPPTVTTGQVVEAQSTARGSLIVATGAFDTFNTTINAPLPTGTNAIGKVITWDGTTVAAVKPASTAAVAADPALVVAVSPNNTVTIQGNQPAATVGTITTNSSVVSMTVNSINVVTVTLTGATFAGVVFVFEGSPDGTNWSALQAARTDSSIIENGSTVALGNANAPRSWDIPVGGLTNIRVRATAWTSGTATITMIGQVFAYDPCPTMGISAGAGTGPVTVKAASTASAATDLPLVVALHPSSPVTQAAITKGTQGLTGVTTQDLKDAGRATVMFTGSWVTTAIAETLMQFVTSNANGAVSGAVTSYTVTAAKRLRIQAILASARISTGTTARTITLRARTTGTPPATATSNLQLIAVTALAASTTAPVAFPALNALPDGWEIPAGTAIAFTVADTGFTVTTQLATIDFTIIAYEY